MLTIILWMLFFSLLHSVMADKRFKDWIGKRFGMRLYHGFYRLVYNVVALLSLVPVLIVLVQESRVLYAVPAWIAPIFSIIQVIGSIGLLVSLIQIDWLRFGGLRQAYAFVMGNPLPLADEPLVTNGLYAFVRHPLYFFSLLALWFSPVMSDGFFYFNLAATAYFIFGSLIEERRMLSAYGESYAQYQKQVGWLIPFIHFPN